MDLANLRVRKDVSELSLSRFKCANASTFIELPDGMENILSLKITVNISELGGFYANGDFSFSIKIPQTYPFHAPTVICTTRIWHPNIDLNTGKVMLPILGKDWRPVLSINTILLGLQLLLLEPNPDFIANPEAAELLRVNTEDFRVMVQNTLKGGNYFGLEFRPHQKWSKAEAPMLLKRVRSKSCEEIYENSVPRLHALASTLDSSPKRFCLHNFESHEIRRATLL